MENVKEIELCLCITLKKNESYSKVEGRQRSIKKKCNNFLHWQNQLRNIFASGFSNFCCLEFTLASTIFKS